MSTTTVTLKAATPLKAGNNDVQPAADASFTFQNAGSLDEVAEQLASISPAALALNRVTAGLDRQLISADADPSHIPGFELGTGVAGYAVGDALDITYRGNGRRISTDRGQPPALVSATVENAAPTILVLTFSANVNSLSNDYKTGFSCKVGGVNRVINSSARQVDHKVVKHTLASAVVNGDVVTFSYAIATGDLKTDNGAKLQSNTDTAVTNNVA